MPGISLRDSVVAVTGASGFIGGHLVDRLCNLGADVYGIARSESSFSHERYHPVALDLVRYNAVKRTLGALKPDFIFHLASYVMGAPDLRHVIPAFRANLASCVHVLSACAEKDVAKHRIVLTGSLVEPPPEYMEIVPSSPYAAAKWAASSYARMFHALYDLPTTIARVFMVYGPAQRDESKLVPYFVKTLLAGRSPKLTSGTRLIDWIYVSDVVDGFIAIATTPGIEGQSIDLGSGQLIATRDFVTKIAELVGTPLRPEIGTLPDRPMEPVFRADVEMSFRKVGWRPRTSLEQGLTEVIRYYRRRVP
jgi:nucleoside-diphosphate-sugar epimerase